MKRSVGSEAGAVECDTFEHLSSVNSEKVSLTVYAEASIVDAFVAGCARTFVLSLDVETLLVADVTVFQHVFRTFLLHDAFCGIDDILTRRTEALRAMRGDFAVVITLEVLAKRPIFARELVVGTVDVSVAEL